MIFAQVLDALQEDLTRLAGIRHELFGEPVAGGFQALNPGLARGVLRFTHPGMDPEDFQPDGIYVLPETIQDLPRVAGILTAGQGNALSHVQLLARNFGIPNAVISHDLLAGFGNREGSRIVMAVSPGGVVRLMPDGPGWDPVFRKQRATLATELRPDTSRLNLTARRLVSLAELDIGDSGRIAGPKAANLAGLKQRSPQMVADGVVIPFGEFRALLEHPMETGGNPMFQWMVSRYESLRRMPPGSAQRRQATGEFLTRVRKWIETTDPGPEFRKRLAAKLEKVCGPDGTYGVFVRSDTNIEDLPGFSGAGLNLTVPHVVGFENIVKAVSRVWASPFTERAFGWRQAFMDQPEHVYASVLLMISVPVEKSGVVVTVDVDTGQSARLSVAASEGVGGAVSGQSAEELRIAMGNGTVRLMAEATEPLKRVLAPRGGIAKVPASGGHTLLLPREIDQLRELAAGLPGRFPGLRDPGGRVIPADIEFGFLDQRLVLFQIRPFVENIRARRNNILIDLDTGFEKMAERRVDLNQRPNGEAS